jgi:hypothetical protein
MHRKKTAQVIPDHGPHTCTHVPRDLAQPSPLVRELTEFRTPMWANPRAAACVFDAAVSVDEAAARRAELYG